MTIPGWAKLKVVAGLFGLAMLSQAGVYQIAIDTSSQSGVNGAIYLQFNGGLNADLASVSITSFSIGAPGGLNALPPGFSDGGVTGSLDALPLVIDNSGGLNDYLHYLTFGANLVFVADIEFPAVLTGDSGSTFSFGLTADDGQTPVLTVDPSGFVGQISYDTTGAFSVSTLANDSIETISTNALPEPGTGLLIAGALAAGVMSLRRRR
jgi:hypothetical protein